MNHHSLHTITPSLSDRLDELAAGCDPDFDAAHEEIERQFAELRLPTGNDDATDAGVQP